MPDRVLILAPRGRDAAIAADLLTRSGFRAHVCADHRALLAELDAGAGVVLLTEEALAGGDVAALTGWVARQPPWAEVPFVVLANGAQAPRTLAAMARLDDLGNVVLLARPLHAEAIVGAVRSALKARVRQYEVRDAADRLERAVVDRTRELEAARDSLAFALEAAGMGSWDIDLASGAARRSPRHDAIFGYERLLPDWTVETFLGHVDAGQREEMADAFDAALRTGTLDIECRITGADGRIRWIVAKGRVRHDAAGVPVRMTGVVSDVTDRRDADEQLAQAHKMDAIGQLTGGVAHDFNNLLTPIVGSLDLLRRRHRDDARSQRMIDGALQAADRAATLTQRLLAFARRQALQPRAVDVGALIDGIVDLVRRSLGPSIEVVVTVEPPVSPACVDPNQLELALLNLAINARDAMPGGGRLSLTVDAVTVATHDAGRPHDAPALAPGTYVRLSAIDTGTGMDRQTLARATEPFFSTKDIGKGTGLGLSMIHGLAAQSGGTLRLASELGSGTTVELWLPATEEAVDGLDAPLAEPVDAPHAATVLLVDDEAVVRATTADMLRDIGYRVIETDGGAQALSALRSGVAADILVSDYLMPGMTGGQLIHAIRRTGLTIPTLLITGYAAAGEDVPADVTRLAKPFRQVDLAARVDALLRPPLSPAEPCAAV